MSAPKITQTIHAPALPGGHHPLCPCPDCEIDRRAATHDAGPVVVGRESDGALILEWPREPKPEPCSICGATGDPVTRQHRRLPRIEAVYP